MNMDKRQALQQLIAATPYNDEDKNLLMQAIPEMSDDEVREYGKSLAQELVRQREALRETVTRIDEAIEENDSVQKNS